MLYKCKICVQQYDGCTIPSSNVEIEGKYVQGTLILVYPQVFSTYVYTYVALHICHCLKCMLLPKNTIYDYKKSKTMKNTFISIPASFPSPSPLHHWADYILIPQFLHSGPPKIVSRFLQHLQWLSANLLRLPTSLLLPTSHQPLSISPFVVTNTQQQDNEISSG